MCVALFTSLRVYVLLGLSSYQCVYVRRPLPINTCMCLALFLSVRVRVSLSSYQCVHVCHSLPISACMCAALSISRNTCGRTCKRSNSFALLLVQTPSVSSSPHIPHPNLPLPTLDSFHLAATLLPLHPSFSIRTCTHTHVHTYTHVRTHANLNFTILHCPLFAIALPVSRHGPSEKRTHEHTHTYTYTHTHALTYTPTHIYTCTHMHVRTCIHVHAYR